MCSSTHLEDLGQQGQQACIGHHRRISADEQQGFQGAAVLHHLLGLHLAAACLLQLHRNRGQGPRQALVVHHDVVEVVQTGRPAHTPGNEGHRLLLGGGDDWGRQQQRGQGGLPCRVFSPQAWRAQPRGWGGGGVPAALPPPLAASFLATPCVTSASGSRSSVSPARSCPRSPGAGGGPGQAWRWRQRSTAPPCMPYGLCWGCRDGGACKTTQCQSGEVDGNQSRVASYQPATEVPESGEAGGAICAN